MDVRVGLWRKLSAEELMLLKLEKTLESPLGCKEIQPVHPKGDQSWVVIGGTDVEAETPILWPPDASWLIWKDPDAGKDWGQEERGNDRGWDGWMASPTRWKWVWVDSRRWWWTGRPGVLQFMGSKRVRHDWATELNWTGNQGGVTSQSSPRSGHWVGRVCVAWVCDCGLSLLTQWLSSWATEEGELKPQPQCFPPSIITLLGYSVHEILQARTSEWVAIPFSGRSSWPRNQTWVSYTVGTFFFIIWAIGEATPQQLPLSPNCYPGATIDNSSLSAARETNVQGEERLVAHPDKYFLRQRDRLHLQAGDLEQILWKLIVIRHLSNQFLLWGVGTRPGEIANEHLLLFSVLKHCRRWFTYTAQLLLKILRDEYN